METQETKAVAEVTENAVMEAEAWEENNEEENARKYLPSDWLVGKTIEELVIMEKELRTSLRTLRMLASGLELEDCISGYRGGYSERRDEVNEEIRHGMEDLMIINNAIVVLRDGKPIQFG
jgi:hypothetical protein